METIAYLTKFVLCAAGAFVFLCFAGWLVWKVGQGYNSYLQKIIDLECYVEGMEVTKKNCMFILDRFAEVSVDRNRDKKRNKRLFVKFCRKFKDELK